MSVLSVFVPAHGSILRSTILAGSALVGSPDLEGDRVLIDFEGNKYNAVNLRTYQERLLHAAGRHIQHYPTVSRCAALRTDLIEVGLYDYDRQQLIVTNQTELEEWSPHEHHESR